jgi:hypothetical protein
MIFLGMNLPWAEILTILQIITIVLLVYYIKKKQ